MDDKILKYLDDDGFPVEPIYYGPIIPMLLVNGSRVLALVSQPILCATIRKILSNLLIRLKGKSGGDDQPILKPYYEGFKGNIEKLEERNI